jgi:hypothetical protein
MSSARIYVALHLGSHEICLFSGGYEYSLPQLSSLIGAPAASAGKFTVSVQQVFRHREKTDIDDSRAFTLP